MTILVFADTSALVAQFLKSDSRHPDAERTMRDLLNEGDRLLTTDYIFDELVTRVRSVARHQDAVAVGDGLLASPGMIRIVEVGREMRDEAWRLFRKFKDQRFSFTDCTSFAAMKKHGISRAFTFDDDFLKAGFDSVPRRSKRSDPK